MRLLDNDIVQVFAIGDVRRNVVNIAGQVFQPGEFELRPGATLGSLIDDAQGLLPWALPDRIKVVRQLPLTGRTILHDVDATSVAGKAFLLEEFDAVDVLDARVAYAAGSISVTGAVNAAETRPYSERESLRDAIERSGGLREDAQKVEVYRKWTGPAYNDTTSVRYSFDISPGFARDTSLRGFILERDDRVVVLASPGFREQRFATLRGHFKYPGSYAITENVDQIRDLVLRAGDILPGAYAGGFHLIRGGLDVAINFARAMRGDIQHNIGLLSGDELVIDLNPNTVLVTGAVGRPSLIRYRPGMSLNEYVELAGGPAEHGNVKRAVVTQPSGVSQRVRRVALFFSSSPEITSGSAITVPLKPESTTTSTDVWQRILASATAFASIAVAYAAVVR
ncbi:MAG: SLBB domain-containing protein [Gemmatimonadetes bacterium]|nr:SLBB domain-containing protein [Gemmatimonadota bacterium]